MTADADARDRAGQSPPGRAGRASGPATVKVPRPWQLRTRRLLRRITRSNGFREVVAGLFVAYSRLVWRTSRVTFEPGRAEELHPDGEPGIITFWHGQHFMTPFLRPPNVETHVLISRHRDGDLNARVARRFGLRTIRGSTARNPARMFEKGSMAGFVGMKDALDRGACVAMTADLSNVEARRAGLGVVSLARASGKPILPLAFATSRRIDFKSWDRATLNLPFSRAACVFGELITVPGDADSEALEEKRREVEEALNAVTERAYAIVDRRHG